MKKSNEDYWREWMSLSSNFYKNKMLAIKCGHPVSPESLLGKVRDEVSPNEWMYKSATLGSPDGKFFYEFLVEYDIYHPSVGIYFGVKLISNPGYDHDENILSALRQWEEIRPTLTMYLNNTFPDIDFSNRFLTTDNANDHTFWPFWIQLYHSEDINDVAIRALGVIYRTYRDFLSGTMRKFSGDITDLIKTGKKVATAFDADALSNLKETVKKCIGKIGADTGAKKKAWEDFRKMVQRAEKAGILMRDDTYEVAWRLTDGLSDTDFCCLMRLIFEEISNSYYRRANDNNTIDNKANDNDKAMKKSEVPWIALRKVFQRANGVTFPEEVRTNKTTAKKKKAMREQLSDNDGK